MALHFACQQQHGPHPRHPKKQSNWEHVTTKGSWVEGNVALLSHVSVGIFNEELLPPLQTCVCVCVMFACVESCWFEQWVTKTGSTDKCSSYRNRNACWSERKRHVISSQKSPNKTRFVLPKHWCIKRGLSKAYGSGGGKTKAVLIPTVKEAESY